MIERVKAQTGDVVFRREGRLLASAVDPRIEAVKWVDRRRNYLGSVKTIFVLGVGAGYHIEELCKRTSAAIVVIDSDAETAQAASELHKWPNVKILVVGSAAALRAEPLVRKALTQSHIVFGHAPTLSLDSDLYTQLRSQLTARDWGSLTWQWQLRGHPTFEFEAKIGGPALSIHDLEQSELVQNSDERESMLVKALKELIK